MTPSRACHLHIRVLIMDEIHDGIILGGGCAGLALAREICMTGKALKVVIIEPRVVYEEDRTWCFWTQVKDTVRPDPAAEWDSWTFSVAGVRIVHRGGTWRYVLMRSRDYYDHALSVIRSFPHIRLQLGMRAGGIKLDHGLCSVEAGGTRLLSRWVVDTRPPSQERLAAAPFTQAFCGLELETDCDIFDPRAAVLMGDMRVIDEGFAFDYVLPLTPRRALFEHTVFSRTPPVSSVLSDTCRTRAHAVYGNGVRYLREERGWIPMGLPLYPDTAGPVIRAGVTGGAVRASSGYAFRRIQRWASACALTLANGGAPLAMGLYGSAASFMDRVFLQAMAQHEDRTPGYFLKIARALSGDRFARFMSDEAGAMDWLRIVAALPKRDFLSAMGSAIVRHAR